MMSKMSGGVEGASIGDFSTVSGGSMCSGKVREDLEDGELELYNLRDDISEHNNLIQLYPERAEKMHKLLSDWRKNVEAKPLRPNPKTGNVKPGVGSKSVKEL